MPRGKKDLAEEIIPYAASVEVEVGRGKTVAEAVKKIGVTECLTRCSRPRCSSNGGGGTTTRSSRKAPWVPSPGSRGAAAPCGHLGYASATAQGWVC